MLKKSFLLGCTADRAFYMLLNHVVLGYISYTQVSNFIVSWYKFLNKLLKKYYQAIVRLYC